MDTQIKALLTLLQGTINSLEQIHNLVCESPNKVITANCSRNINDLINCFSRYKVQLEELSIQFDNFDITEFDELKTRFYKVTYQLDGFENPVVNKNCN